FFFQAEDGIRDSSVTGVQTCALPISFSRRFCPKRRTRERIVKLRAIEPGVTINTTLLHSEELGDQKLLKGREGRPCSGRASYKHTHSPCLSQTQSVLDCRHLCWTPSHIHTDFYWSVSLSHTHTHAYCTIGSDHS